MNVNPQWLSEPRFLVSRDDVPNFSRQLATDSVEVCLHRGLLSGSFDAQMSRIKRQIEWRSPDLEYIGLVGTFLRERGLHCEDTTGHLCSKSLLCILIVSSSHERWVRCCVHLVQLLSMLLFFESCQSKIYA